MSVEPTSASASTPDTPTESSVEGVKRASHALRGTLHTSVVSDSASFDEGDATLLKFHGIYQQDDRDRRVKRGDAAPTAWQMMIRLTIPGGVLTAEQYLVLDELADDVGNGTLRLTTRQSVQFHGVQKRDLKTLMSRLHSTALTTLAACGDVSRNVMASPAPIDDAVHRDVQAVARAVAIELAPRTGAYFEVWLDGERVADTRDEEPIYGTTYLPRKFKVGIAIDTDNAVDLYSYDCGLVAITEGGAVRGYTLLVGGGFGMTHNKANTIARLATPLCFVGPEHGAAIVRAVCELYRDEGNRSNRKQARLKYLVEAWGADRFREALQARVDFALQPPIVVPPPPQEDFLGVHPQGDGRWYVGAFVQNGRIADLPHRQTRSAFRTIVSTLRPGVRLTPGQGILFTDLSEADAARVQALLAAHQVPLEQTLPAVVRYAMACPAMPTCGLALAESERALPALLDALAPTLDALGLSATPLSVRMTGCPNGCARPYNADIGLVGRRPGVYHLFIGGGLRGDRLADLYRADVRLDDVVETLRPVLTHFASQRNADESLGDWYQRVMAKDTPRRLLTGQETPTAPVFLTRITS